MSFQSKRQSQLLVTFPPQQAWRGSRPLFRSVSVTILFVHTAPKNASIKLIFHGMIYSNCLITTAASGNSTVPKEHTCSIKVKANQRVDSDKLGNLKLKLLFSSFLPSLSLFLPPFLSFFLFFFLSSVPTVCKKFQGQESNPHHSCTQSDNAESLTS